MIFASGACGVGELHGIDSGGGGFEVEVRIHMLHIEPDIGPFKVIVESDLLPVGSDDLQGGVKRRTQTASEKFGNDPFSQFRLELEALFLPRS